MTLKNVNDDKRHQIDLEFMKKAIHLAKKAELIGEVPVGALIVDKSGKIISQGINLREKISSVLGHAELIAIHKACKTLKSWRLTGCTLYVTLEPCFMCAGALVQSRISRVVYATKDPKGGALGSLTDLSCDPRLNHRFEKKIGPFEEEAKQQLKLFFKKKRNTK